MTSRLDLTVPGILCGCAEEERQRTAWPAHEDGSARRELRTEHVRKRH
ncbi:hypothetical protein ACWGI9_33250 [Streptomyces sp. NPDC054833]